MKKYSLIIILFLLGMDLTAQIKIYFIGDHDVPFPFPIIYYKEYTEYAEERKIKANDTFEIRYEVVFGNYFKVNLDLYNKIKIYISENAAKTDDYDKEKYFSITGGKWVGGWAKFKILIEEDNKIYYLMFKDVSLQFFNNLIVLLSKEDNTEKLIMFINTELIEGISKYGV